MPMPRTIDEVEDIIAFYENMKEAWDKKAKEAEDKKKKDEPKKPLFVLGAYPATLFFGNRESYEAISIGVIANRPFSLRPERARP